jgi:probable dihydroxyacetone kinase regulator
VSKITKKALAASLKKLLAERPLDKITVIDIVNDCEVNRQTFYYHFQDIYDLLEWVYLNEATKALDGKNTYDTWQQGFYYIFEYVQSNREFVLNTYNSVSRDYLENFLYKETYALLIGVIEEKAKGMQIKQSDKDFIANFYKYAFVGLMLDWIRKGMKENPSYIIEHLNILIHGDVSKALKKFQNSEKE